MTVSVAGNAPASVSNAPTVTGGGDSVVHSSLTDVAPVTQVASLNITSSHSGNFRQGDTADTYALTVTNAAGAGPTSGTVTVTDTLPTGLTPTSAVGQGWTLQGINGSTVTATRSDALAAGLSYPALTVTVSVAASAPASVTNAATVAGGGEVITSNAASDPTTINPAGALAISVSHSGDFNQGDAADTYTVTVSNSGPGSSSGTVTVTDTLPTGLSATAADNATVNGWSVSSSGQTVTATRSDTVASGASFPALTITVSVAGTAASSLTNTVQLSGGGDSSTANLSASDVTTINATSGSLAGFVYVNSSNDGQRLTPQGEAKPGLSGVTVRLLSQNSLGTWTDVSGKSPLQTGANGSYSFTSLAAGTYELQVTPPADFVNGTDTAGTVGGVTQGTVTRDQIQVQLAGGENGTGYNFAVQGLKTSVISLRVFLASTPPMSKFVQQFVTPSSTSAASVSASPAVLQASSVTVNSPNDSSLQSPSPTVASPLASSVALQASSMTVNSPNDSSLQSPSPTGASSLASSAAGLAFSSDKKISAAAVNAVMQQSFLLMASGQR